MLAIIIIIFPFQGSILRLYKRCIFICLKDFSASAGDTRDMGLISGLERSPGGGNDNLLQYSCLENSMGRGDWCCSPWHCKESDTTKRLTLLPLHTRNYLMPGTTSFLRTPSFYLIPQHHFSRPETVFKAPESARNPPTSPYPSALSGL